VLQAHLADRAHRLETHTRLTPRAGRGGAPMPPTRLEGRLREAQQARAQETVAVACPRCGGPVLVPRRRAHLATYCPTCRPLRKRETERQWERQRRSSRHGASQVRVACARSGTAIIVLPVRASRTNYCPTCRQVRKRETGRLANRRYRERHRG
jgi:hypothetical protein